jgi:hypothetical protein
VFRDPVVGQGLGVACGLQARRGAQPALADPADDALVERAARENIAAAGLDLPADQSVNSTPSARRPEHPSPILSWRNKRTRSCAYSPPAR